MSWLSSETFAGFSETFQYPAFYTVMGGDPILTDLAKGLRII